MARMCYRCGKTSILAVTRKLLRGHYNPTGKKRKYPNLQWVRLNSRERVRMCTKCIKTTYKTN